MTNIVILHGKKYLVDVGYGADGPTIPLQLDPSAVREGLPGQELKLDLRSLTQHQDPSQKVWVYSQHRGAGAWQDVYHFPDAEALPHDFDVLNFYNMTNSLWARTVVAQRFCPDGEGRIAETMVLVRGEVKKGDGVNQDPTLLGTLTTEQRRLEAFTGLFGIMLAPEERDAIKGSAAELV